MPSAQDLLNEKLGLSTGPAGLSPTPADTAYQQGVQAANAQLRPNLTPAAPTPADQRFNAAQQGADQGLLDGIKRFFPQKPTKQQDVAATADAKQASLAQTADAKKAELVQQTGAPAVNITNDQMYNAVLARRTGDGLNSMPSQAEADMASMSPLELTNKYGYDRGTQLMQQRTDARNTLSGESTYGDRRVVSGIADFGKGVGLGVANSVGGMAALGAGILNKDAGTQIARGVSDLNDAVQGSETPQMQASRRLNAAKNALGYRDNRAQYATDLEQYGTVGADMRRVVNDAGTAVGNAIDDPLAFQDGTAQGLGSLVTAGPTGKLIGAGAKVALAAAPELGIAPSLLARAAASKTGQYIAHEGPTMAAIGATEAGGAYQQNASDVVKQSFEDLAKNSPMFKELVASGMSKEEARTTVANRSGLIAAAIQAPLATAAGAIASKFEANPFSVPKLRDIGKNVLKEGVEETIQSGTGQWSQNVATQHTANENQDLLEGVGEQAGLGGLYGMSAAGATQGPGAVFSHTVSTALKAGQAVAGAVGKMADKVQERNDRNSPVADHIVAQAATEFEQNAATAGQQAIDSVQASNLSDEKKATASQYIQDLVGSSQFDPKEMEGAPQPLIDAVGNATTRVGMLQNLLSYARNQENPHDVRAMAYGVFKENLDALHQKVAEAPVQLEGLPHDDAAVTFASQIQDLAGKWLDTPSAVRAKESIQKSLDKIVLPELNEESIQTEEGQHGLQTALAMATIDPSKMPAAAVQSINELAAKGRLRLTSQQEAGIRTAMGILAGREKYVSELQANGLNAPKDIVAAQVSTDKGSPEGKDSAAVHLNAIRTAYASGDREGAKTALSNFGKFAQTLQNKVSAVNSQIATHGAQSNDKNSLHYDTVSRDKTKWNKSKRPFGVTPQSPTSVKFVQEVHAEAKALTAMHNALATAYPELGVSHMGQVDLHPSLTGAHPREVAQEWKQGKRTVDTSKVDGKPAAQPTESTATPTESKPAETESNKPTEKPADVASQDLGSKEPSKVGAKEESKSQSNAERLAKLTDKQIEASIKGLEAMDKAGTITSANAELLDNLRWEQQSRVPAEAKPAATVTDEGTKPQVTEQKAEPAAEKVETVADEATDSTTHAKVGDAHADNAVAQTYPDLINPGTGNRFVTAFSLPTTARSNLAGSENPLETVTQALRSESSFAAMVAGKMKAGFDLTVGRNYRDFLSLVPGIVDEIGRHMQAFLDQTPEKGKQAGTSIEEALHLAEIDPHRYRQGKLLNLAVQNADGTLSLHQGLMETAVLAGMQWLLTARNNVGKLDEKKAANILGIDESEVRDGMVDLLEDGVLRLSAVQALAAKITQYWGLTENRDETKGFTEGIAQAAAAEVLRTLTDPKLTVEVPVRNPDTGEVVKYRTVPLLGEETQYFDREAKVFVDQKNANTQEINVLKPAFMEDLSVYPDAIEQLVATEPEMTHHFDQDLPKVAERQMNNPDVENTSEQRNMIEREQKTGHFLNERMAALYTALGLPTILDIFGAGANLDPEYVNVENMKTRDGRNRTISSAFETAFATVDALRQHAKQAGKDAVDVAVHYGYNITRVGRLQMLGKYNPQSSKLMRELILPTVATLDLTGRQRRAFNLAVAQGIGVKVHNLPYRSMVREMNKELAKMRPAIDALKEFQKSGTLNTEQMKTGLGKGATFVQLHALSEFARFEAATEAEKKAFKTQLYLEADGMTNGPINAMALLGTGSFAPEWVENMGLGGLWFGGLKNQTSTAQRNGSTDDLYQRLASITRKKVMELRKALSKPMLDQQTALIKLMNQLMPKDVVLTADGDLDLTRGIAKNPLTITIYGSGSQGIAGKLTKAVTDAIYEKMTQALEYKRTNPDATEAEAMFGPGKAGEDAYKLFNDSIKSLITQQVTYEWKRGVKVRVMEQTAGRFDLSQGFQGATLNAEAHASIQENMHNLFVEKMTDAIESVVDQSVLKSADRIRKATQVQSIVLQHLFVQKVKEAIVKKKESDPNYKGGDFLSQNELDAIKKSLSSLAPIIDTGSQRFYVAGNEKATIAKDNKGGKENLAGYGYARAFDDTFGIPAMVNGPFNAGVAGIPFLNIGMGDGMMMQHIANYLNAPERTLKIFDGMNMPLDAIDEQSVMANQGVYDSWQGNPLQAVSETFDKFMENWNGKDTGFGETFARDMQIALYGWGKDGQGRNLRDFLGEMKRLQAELKQTALEAEARHRTIARVNTSVDQMAAASSPYQVTDKESVTGTSEEVAARLNEIYAEERAKLMKERPQTSDFIKSELLQGANQDKDSGVRILNGVELKNLPGLLADKIPANMKPLIDSALHALRNSNTQIIMGTREQLMKHARLHAGALVQEGISRGDVQGMYDPTTGHLWMIEPSAEVLTHELIHAATVRIIDTFYKGGDLGKNARVVRDSIGNIEQLMGQFLSLNPDEMTPDQREAFGWLKAQLDQHAEMAENDRKVYDLSEFIAWALANQNLAAVGEKAQAPAIVRIARQVVQYLKSLFTGSNKPEVLSPLNDIFSNLRFNTQLIMAAQPTLRGVMADVAPLAMQNATYGDDERLAEVGQTFDRTVADWVDDTPEVSLERDQRKTTLSDAGQMIGTLSRQFVGTFGMNMQQAVVFKKIMTALSTEAKFDGNVMARMQDLFAHVTKNLTAEKLMDPVKAGKEGSDTWERERNYAAEKLNAMLGRKGSLTDAAGRSTLLPAFVALALTNPDLRRALADIKMPTTDKSNASSKTDAALEDFASSVMQALGRRLSGEGKAENVQQAMDMMAEQLREIADDQQAFFDQIANPIGDLSDRTNQIVIDAMNSLARWATGKADALHTRYNNKLTKLMATGAKVTEAIVNNDAAAQVAEGVLSMINRVDGFAPFRELIGDMVGRTLSNAAVYDMIKTVRSWIQADRQQYREIVPNTIAEQFSRELTEDEWSMLHRAMGRTDLASLVQGMSQDEVLKLLSNSKAMKAKVSELEQAIKGADSANWKLYEKKMKQLAEYMMTGVPGTKLLRNAQAIAKLLNEGTAKKSLIQDPKAFVNNIDMLTTLYAMEHLEDAHRLSLGTLADTQAKGMNFALAYLQGQRVEEQNRTVENPRALFNAYKGYIPSVQESGKSLIVADDTEYSNLTSRSYVRVGDYTGSLSERAGGVVSKKGYYFAPVSGRNIFQQGILQNVRQTAGGVDAATGYTVGSMTAGRITDPKAIDRIKMNLTAGLEGPNESLLPVYDDGGQLVALERSIDPAQLERLDFNTQLHQMVGVWRGRQVEEAKSAIYNDALVDRLAEMWEKDGATDRANEYVNVFDAKTLAKDPVLSDAVALITPLMKDRIEDSFGQDTFWVRRELLNDALGYRAASVGDAWTGTSRWSESTQKHFKNAAMAVFGNKAYQYAVNAEKLLQNVVSDAKTLIVVKSIVVPVGNMVSNMYQLASRGVPIKHIVTGLPRKTAEVQTFVKNEVRRVKAEAELRVAEGLNDVKKQHELRTEIQSIADIHRRLSIWPLIEAGEFSAISDGRATPEDIEITSGRLHGAIESLVHKLPAGVRTAGRYAMITKDTALFRGMQTATEYGDFLAKAILFDDITKRKKGTVAEALAAVTEEFVNYDRLPGRARGYLESIGAMWFYNFKIRSTKIALSTIRNNPVHALLAGLAPTPEFLGSIGTPMGDNLISKAANGQLTFSFGFGQIMHAPMMNPWLHLTK